eukprot:7112716-Prymnesium_polylepis.1
MSSGGKTGGRTKPHLRNASRSECSGLLASVHAVEWRRAPTVELLTVSELNDGRPRHAQGRGH